MRLAELMPLDRRNVVEVMPRFLALFLSQDRRLQRRICVALPLIELKPTRCGHCHGLSLTAAFLPLPVGL
jgi:hypothetical protein